MDLLVTALRMRTALTISSAANALFAAAEHTPHRKPHEGSDRNEYGKCSEIHGKASYVLFSQGPGFRRSVEPRALWKTGSMYALGKGSHLAY